MSLPRPYFPATNATGKEAARNHDSGPALSLFGNAQSETKPVAIADMDDETLESAAIVAAMTHRQTCSREAYDRLTAINAERRRRKGLIA